MARISISTWTLHGLLGKARYEPGGKGGLVNRSGEEPEMSLLEVPSAIAKRGIRTLEICHFHFPSVDSTYLDEVRSAVDESGVELFSILVDAGDIAHPDAATRARDRRMVRQWVTRAAACGASHVRVIAGDQEATGRTVALSVEGLSDLARAGADFGLRVITENFKRLARTPETVLEILERCRGEVGLCVDFGNFPRETRAADLAAVAPKADSVHAKADYGADGTMDRRSFEMHLDLVVRSGFRGPVSLIHQDGGDTWEKVEEMKEGVAKFI